MIDDKRQKVLIASSTVTENAHRQKRFFTLAIAGAILIGTSTMFIHEIRVGYEHLMRRGQQIGDNSDELEK